MKKITTIFLAVVALLASCEKSHIELNTPEEAREAIELTLGALTVDQMGAGTAEAAQPEDETIPLTKSSLSTEPSTTIKNLWVLQFSNQGALLGEPQYLDSFDVEGDNMVKLIPTGTEEGSKSTIVYLANTFDKYLIKKNYTIDDVAALYHSITDEGSNFITVDKENNVTTDEDGIKYMIMYGSIKQAVTSGDSLDECQLKRTVAKITVTIINDGTDLKFLRAEIDGIPNRSYYYPTLTEKHPADGTFHTIDYPEEELNGKISFTFYVPTNRRGVVNNNSQLSKNHFGSHDKTSINITAQDKSGDIYYYTFFLGADLTKDFNIDCDKEYKYNLTFKSKGDPNYDERVTILNNIDYTKNTIPRSNCYILNPSDITAQTIYIPIDRIDEFWKKGNGYFTENNLYIDNTIANVNNNWEAVLMWHDSEYTLDEDKTLGGLKVAKGTSPSTHEACVVVTLPRYYKHCNVGFVVRRTDEDHKGVILWSWHLWITDYNPYPKSLMPSLDIWSYDVDGGALHRYNNPAFVGGIYSDKFIMDRNIGARSADFEGHGSISNNTISAGSLYYQFGRKDPFPSVTTKYLNGYTCTTGGDAAKQQSFEYSVNNPEKFIYINENDNWCRSDDSKNTRYIWNDHKIEVENYTSGKSIFDPSPLGFRLPISDTWSDFTGGNSSTETVPNNYTFIWTRYTTPILEKYNYGRLYTGYAYYPASGQMPNNKKVAVGYNGVNGYCWSANPSSESNGYSLGFGATFLNKKLSVLRAKGYPVRPIQE